MKPKKIPPSRKLVLECRPRTISPRQDPVKSQVCNGVVWEKIDRDEGRLKLESPILSMFARLFLIYLRAKKPLILVTAALALISVSLNLWSSYKIRATKLGTWAVVEVLSGERFTVKRDGQTKTIRLCGISAPGEKAKEYLLDSIQRGDGTFELERVGNTFEAWVMLSPDYREQIHLNTWLVQNGMARHDEHSSRQCLAHENLVWAEELAQEEKLGIWSTSDEN